MQDDDWFLFWMDIIGLTKQCYNVFSDKWEQLPFSGGLFEQADANPFLWSAICYIIEKEKERVRGHAESKH